MLTKWWTKKLATSLFCMALLVSVLHLTHLATKSTAQAGLDGGAVYRNHCLACHGTDGKNGFSPELVGSQFMAKFPTEQQLTAYISREMPIGNPGGLSAAEYTAISKYIMSLNKPSTPPVSAKRKLNIIGKRIWLDGNELRLTAQPQLVNGKLLVPFRSIFDAFQVTSSWNNSTRTITARSSKLTLNLTVGSRQANVNGRTVTLDAAPRIIGGSTLVPLRFVGETLGADVNYRSQ